MHQSEEKSDVSKDSFCEEREQVFDHSANYHKRSLLRNFNAKVGRENIFTPTIWNEDSNDNGVRIVNFTTSKNLVVKSMMFVHQNIRKYTWISPDGTTHNLIVHTLIDRRWQSSILEVQFFRGVECDTDHYLVVAKLGKDRQSVNKQHRNWCGKI